MRRSVIILQTFDIEPGGEKKKTKKKRSIQQNAYKKALPQNIFLPPNSQSAKRTEVVRSFLGFSLEDEV